VPHRISVLVPAYNERATIAAVLDRLFSIDLPAPREVIVIDDGSSDGTRDVLQALPPLARAPDSLVIVHAEANRGKGHAIRLGLARATGTIIAIQDADLELDPAQLADLVGPILRDETDVVYGSRFLHGAGNTPTVSYVANRALTTVTNLLYGGSLTDMETCYKVMRTSVMRALTLTADRFDIEPEITAKLLRAGHRIIERPVTFSPRSRAAGKKIGWRDGIVALRVLVRHRFR
jgi:glycosyltransferase involved in cell wall biosynthesis